MHAEFFDEYLPVRKYDSTHFIPSIAGKAQLSHIHMNFNFS